MSKSYNYGISGEMAAVQYLEQNGYRILAKNWRSGHREIDVICRKEELTVFVEVKTRQCVVDLPSDVLSIKKQQMLLTAANDYIVKNNVKDEIRFDLLIVIGTQFQIQHIEDAIQG